LANIEPQSFRDKLGMLDEKGSRLAIIPAEVKGRFRRYRTIMQIALIALYLVLPWIQIHGRPLILLDLPGRHFSLFGLEFWAHDAPLIFFVLAISTVSLILVTALLGRVWCGWACPQTVFLDGLFRRIETWVEGSHLKQRELALAPLSGTKIFKKTVKWFLFIMITLVITHTFLAYFTGTEALLNMITSHPKEHWGAFLFVMVLSVLFLFDLTWFREQFCLIMCPYGRFQSVLYDKQTITVQYDETRGEPRKGFKTSDLSTNSTLSGNLDTSGIPGSQSFSEVSGTPHSVITLQQTLQQTKPTGDCVNCKRCIQVCPTGIDIRNGLQMECIACTACIDACDEIMDKVKKPRGLIRYMSSETPISFLRPRVLAYSGALFLFIVVLTTILLMKADLHVQVLRSIDTPYFRKVENNQNYIVNSYRLHVQNQKQEQTTLEIHLVDKALEEKGWKLQVPTSVLILKPQEFKMIPFLIQVPENQLSSQGKHQLQIQVQNIIRDINFVGPNQ
jgi:polyferredoxin